MYLVTEVVRDKETWWVDVQEEDSDNLWRILPVEDGNYKANYHVIN